MPPATEGGAVPQSDVTCGELLGHDAGDALAGEGERGIAMEPAGGGQLTREEFACQFNLARQRQHLSIRAAARLAGVHPATVQGWFNGRHRPTPALRPKYLVLVEALGLVAQMPQDLLADQPSGAEPH